MKRTIAIIIVLINTIIVSSQRNISLNINPETINGVKYIKVNIKNNNPEEIVVFTRARWDPSGFEFFTYPLSFLVFKGYYSGVEIETEKVLLTKELSEYNSTRFFTIIKAGATHSVTYNLFYGDGVGYELFKKSHKSVVEKIQARLKMDFGYEKKVYSIELDSNIVTIK